MEMKLSKKILITKIIYMKKLLFVSIASFVFSMGAIAQSTTPPASEKKAAMKDLRKDVRGVHKDKAVLKNEVKEGDKEAAKALKKDINSDRKDIKQDAKYLKADGVKHPVKRAARQMRRARKNS